jgi:hypothetical protein
VNDVVVLKDWLSEDEKFVIIRQDKEHANRPVACGGHVHDVVFMLNFDPVTAKHPP